MRELKFRAWDKEYNQMMDADYFGIDEYITPEGGVVEKETHSGYGFSDMYMVDISDKRILMQYTGLKDKNGREIYEGDVVTDDTNYYLVEFTHGMFKPICYAELEENGSAWGYKVVGNVFENPELLGDSR